MQALSNNLISEVNEKLKYTFSETDFEELKAIYLETNGLLRNAMKQMRNLIPEERPEFWKK
jgi:hypothetical protein